MLLVLLVIFTNHGMSQKNGSCSSAYFDWLLIIDKWISLIGHMANQHQNKTTSKDIDIYISDN